MLKRQHESVSLILQWSHLISQQLHLPVIAELRLKSLDSYLILFNYFLEYSLFDSIAPIVVQIVPVLDGIAFDFINLYFCTLLNFHGFLTEFQAANGLLYLWAGWSYANDYACSWVTCQWAPEDLCQGRVSVGNVLWCLLREHVDHLCKIEETLVDTQAFFQSGAVAEFGALSASCAQVVRNLFTSSQVYEIQIAADFEAAVALGILRSRERCDVKSEQSMRSTRAMVQICLSVVTVSLTNRYQIKNLLDTAYLYLISSFDEEFLILSFVYWEHVLADGLAIACKQIMYHFVVYLDIGQFHLKLCYIIHTSLCNFHLTHSLE